MASYIDIDCWIQEHVLLNTALITSPPLPAQRKRALADMDPNSQRLTTSKHRKVINASPNYAYADNNDDIESTPRDLYRLRLDTDAPNLPPPPQVPSSRPPSPSRSTSPSKRGRTTDDEPGSSRPSKISRQSRSTSPQKQLAEIRIVKPALLSDWATVPSDVRHLARFFKQLKEQRAAILPASCDTPEFRAALSQGDDEEDQELFSHIFARERKYGVGVPDLSWARSIVAKTRANRKRVVCEAHWNSSIHHPILEAALSVFPALAVDNITSATISAPSEVSCKVDFALSLILSETVIRRMFAADVLSLNHTDYFPLRHSPIGVSIETKCDSGEEPKAKVQLSMWASAQVTALKVMLTKAGRPGVRVPPLPLVFVAGDVWTFWCWRDGQEEEARETDESEDTTARHGTSANSRDVDITGIEGGGMFFSDGFQFGTTATVLGCYEVVAGLRRLAEWADQEWRQWWEKELLGPLQLQVIDGTKSE